MITQTTAATLAAVLGLLALTGTAQVWHVYLIATLLGFVTAVDNPTRQVFVAELVGDRHVRNAVSLNSSVFQFGALVGPALSGVLIHAVGQGWSFLINAASCLVVVTNADASSGSNPEPYGAASELRASCEPACATSGRSPRSAGRSSSSPRWASSASTCRSSWRRSRNRSSPPAWVATACSTP